MRFEYDLFQGVACQRPDCDDGLGHILSIGADILHGCRPHQAGDSGQTFHARQIGVDATLNQLIPRLPGGSGDDGGVGIGFELDAPKPDVDDKTVEARIIEDGVAAPTQHVHRCPATCRPRQCLAQIIVAGAPCQKASGPSETQTGEGRQRDVLFNIHRL